MTIAVNTRLNKETQPEGYEEFIYSILNQLTEKFPQHQFIYFFDRPYDEKIVFTKNVMPVVAGPKTSSILCLQYWFNYRIPGLLRKHKADVFVSMEGICSLRTKVPQCLIISDLSFLTHPQQLKKYQARFYTKFTPAFLAKAKGIATVSTFTKSLIANRYKINADEIAVINPVIDAIFTPLNWEEKEHIKEKYAEGKAYFLCSGNSNLINLLKAFSFFKKRQKSNMLLLIESPDKAELAKITASAYAMVYPVLYDDMALPALQAIQCNVPVVISDAGALPSVFGEAALYVNPDSHEDIAQKMMLVFKDEDKANELVKAGNELLQQYQPGKTADLLMQCILKAAN
jgi:hypothetical protein